MDTALLVPPDRVMVKTPGWGPAIEVVAVTDRTGLPLCALADA